MKINLQGKPFNLKKTLYSGQTPTFVFQEKNNHHYGYIKEKKHEPIKIQQRNNKLLINSPISKKLIKNYLGLNNDLKRIYKEINTDKIMENLIKKYEGLRITKSDPLLTILVFLSSQNNSMYNIRNFLQILSKKFGKEIKFRENKINLPPSEDKLFKLNEDDFRECKAGYRAEYMEKTFKDIQNEEIKLNKLNNLPHHEVREELKKLKGIGDKVADCISLFGYNNLESFPIDTHIKKVMEKEYNKDLTKEKIQKLSKTKWNGFAGYAQQYLYMKEIS